MLPSSSSSTLSFERGAGASFAGALRGVIRKHGGGLATLALASKALKGLVTTQVVANALGGLPFARGGTSMSGRDPLSKLLDSIRV